MKNQLWCAVVASAAALSGCTQGGGLRGEDAVAQTEQAAQVAEYKSKWRGSSVSVSTSTELSGQTINVWENKDGKTRSVSLEYYAFAYDPDSEVCEIESVCWIDETGTEVCEDYEYCYYADYTYRYGYGEIPSSSFKAGKKAGSLDVSTAGLPNFSAFECSTAQPDCVPFSGDVAISWEANGTYASQNNGTSSFSYSFDGVTYTSRSTGQSSSRSIDASGSAFGQSVDGASGDLSESKGSGVTKEIIKS